MNRICAQNHLKRWSPALGNEGNSQQAGLPTFTPNKRTPKQDGVACAWNYLKRWSHALDIEGNSQQAGLPTYTRWVDISSAWMMPPLHGTTSNGGPLRWIMKAIPKQAWSIPTFIPNKWTLQQDGVPCARNYLKWWSRARIMKAIPSKLVFSTSIRT